MVRQKRLRLFASYQNYFSMVKQINVHDEFLSLKQWCKVLFQETHMLIVPTYDQFYCVFKSRTYKKQGQLQF